MAATTAQRLRVTALLTFRSPGPADIRTHRSKSSTATISKLSAKSFINSSWSFDNFLSMEMDRRAFLLSSAAAMFQMQGFKPGLIVRSEGPVDLETPLSKLDKSWITAIENHYVRCHLPTPKIDDSMVKTWALTIEGEVSQALKLTMDDLRRYREVSQTVTLECSGNGRVYASPAVPGLQWEKGAVSTAKWTGVSLRDLLTKAGVKT